MFVDGRRKEKEGKLHRTIVGDVWLAFDRMVKILDVEKTANK